MEQAKVDNFIQEMIPFVLSAGAFAQEAQGSVENIGKTAPGDVADTEFARAGRDAKR